MRYGWCSLLTFPSAEKDPRECLRCAKRALFNRLLDKVNCFILVEISTIEMNCFLFGFVLWWLLEGSPSSAETPNLVCYQEAIQGSEASELNVDCCKTETACFSLWADVPDVSMTHYQGPGSIEFSTTVMLA